MSTAIGSIFSTDSPPFPIHRFTVEEYHQLGDAGVLTDEDRVELLEGWIVEKMNQRPAHGFVVGVVNEWLITRLSAGWIGRCQLPITLDKSEPEPDLAIVRGTHSDYRDRHPGGNDCRLVIEVADTSLTKDRAKAAIYAAANVEEYWIINLAEKTIEKMTRPEELKYVDSITLGRDDKIETCVGEQNIEMSLADIFEA